MSRRRRPPLAPTAETVRRDPYARWRFTHRGTPIEYVLSGVVVNAETPEELVVETDAEILRRTENERPN
jgi:hypothetical protein